MARYRGRDGHYADVECAHAELERYSGHANRDYGGRFTRSLSAVSGAMTARHFPPPWTVEEQPSCFPVSDANGQALAHIYYEDEPGRQAAAKLLSKDEARRIAANIAKLPVGRKQ